MKNHVAEIQDAAEDVKSHAQATGAAAMEMGRATYRHLQGKATDAAQKTDRAVRGNPYVAVGISFAHPRGENGTIARKLSASAY